MEQVILVNEKDEQMGVEEKMEAHRKGLLHRAFSIFIFNQNGDLLIQQRAKEKYHCGGLWTNTCCSHPRPNEKIEDACSRRLFEEMGFNTKLEEAFTFKYKVTFDNGLIENEVDHIFIGNFDNNPTPNKSEVENYRWVDKHTLLKEIKQYPDNFTHWFKLSINEVLKYYEENY